MSVVNLNRARKARALAAAKAGAAENRILAGRTKTEKAFDEARTEARRRQSEAQRLTPDEPRD